LTVASSSSQQSSIVFQLLSLQKIMFLIFLFTCVTRLTRQVPLVEQELLTLPEHLSPPPVFSGVRVTRSLVLYVCFVDLVFPFVLFLLAIVLSVLLRYTDSDCPFGIFKLFLNIGSQGLKLLRPSELHFYKSKYRSTHLNDAAQQILQHFYYRFFWVFF
jgi:hypothetical protein